MADQLFTEGDVIQPVGSVELQCVGMTFDEFEGVKKNFVYAFRPKSEVSHEQASQVTNQSQPLEEETQHVK